MKNNLILLLSLLFPVLVKSQSQVVTMPLGGNITNGASIWDQLCPGTDVLLKFAFDYPTNKSISTNGLSGVTVIQNIQGNNTAIVRFSDKKEAHQFKIYDVVASTTTSPFVFKCIKTLDGIKPPAGPNPYPYPSWVYNDLLDELSPGGPCKTATFKYTGPQIFYVDADGKTFGTFGMTQYDWLPPKGWKINGIACDGTNPIVTASPAADITPDPISGGEIKMRARNDCDANGLNKSNWYSILLYGRPPISLTVNGANPIQIACEDQAPRTFTVNATDKYSCITGYKWTIGVNWRFSDGTSAPSTFTTSTPSLTLVPIGSAAPGAVSVQLLVNGVPYTTNQFTCPINFVNNPPPPFSIIGENPVCATTPKLFKVSAGNVINWSISPSGQNLVTGVVTGNTITLSRTPSTPSGFITLTATIQNACGAQTTSSMKVAVGSPSPTGLTYVLNACPEYQFYCDYIGGNTYNWSYYNVANPVSETNLTGHSQTVKINFPMGNTQYKVGVSTQNACGLSPKTGVLITTCIFTGSGHRVKKDSIQTINDIKTEGFENLVIYPNPTKHNLIIDLGINMHSNLNGIKSIAVYDAIGALIEKKTYFNLSSRTQLSFDHIKAGVYIIKISDGKNEVSRKVIIEK